MPNGPDSSKGLFPVFKDVSRRMGDAAKLGVKIAGARKAALTLVDIMRGQFGAAWPRFFDTELGKLVEPALVVFGVATVVEVFGTHIPYADKIGRVCNYAMTGVVAKDVDAVIEKFTPFFKNIAAIGLDVVEGDTEAFEELTIVEGEPPALAEEPKRLDGRLTRPEKKEQGEEVEAAAASKVGVHSRA